MLDRVVSSNKFCIFFYYFFCLFFCYFIIKKWNSNTNCLQFYSGLLRMKLVITSSLTLTLISQRRQKVYIWFVMAGVKKQILSWPYAITSEVTQPASKVSFSFSFKRLSYFLWCRGTAEGVQLAACWLLLTSHQMHATQAHFLIDMQSRLLRLQP